MTPALMTRAAEPAPEQGRRGPLTLALTELLLAVLAVAGGAVLLAVLSQLLPG